MPTSNQADIDAGADLLTPKTSAAETQQASGLPFRPVAQTDAYRAPVDLKNPPVKTDGSFDWSELGAGIARGVHKQTDNLAEWLATHLGGEEEGKRIAAADETARTEAAKHTSTTASVGDVAGQAGIIVPTLIGAGGLTKSAIALAGRVPGIAGSALQSIADVAGGAAQGAYGSKATGGDPVAGAIAGGGLSVLGQGAGALRMGLDRDSVLAEALHSKITDLVLGFKYGLIGPVLRGIASRYGAPVANAVSESIARGNQYGIVSGGGGTLAGQTVKNLLTPPAQDNVVPPTVNGLMPQAQTGTAVPPSVGGLLPK